MRTALLPTRRRLISGVATWLAVGSAHGQASSKPAGPVTLVVPFPAGGGTDALARLLAPRLQAAWQLPVLVENQPGAGTTLATAAVARATPDGRTLLLASFAHAVAPALYRKLSYDALRSFVPVAMVASGPNLLLVHPAVPATSVRELVELARQQPAQLTYASFGNASSAHLAGELFALQAGIKLGHVPYRGSGPALTDLIGGRVQMMFDGLPSLAHVKSGRLRALAITSRERHPSLPDVPTVAESGLRGFETGTWFGLLAPEGTPSALVARITTDVRQVLRDPEVRHAIERLGFEPADLDSAGFGRFLAQEVERWGQVVHERGIQAD